MYNGEWQTILEIHLWRIYIYISMDYGHLTQFVYISYISNNLNLQKTDNKFNIESSKTSVIVSFNCLWWFLFWHFDMNGCVMVQKHDCEVCNRVYILDYLWIDSTSIICMISMIIKGADFTAACSSVARKIVLSWQKKRGILLMRIDEREDKEMHIKQGTEENR